MKFNEVFGIYKIFYVISIFSNTVEFYLRKCLHRIFHPLAVLESNRFTYVCRQNCILLMWKGTFKALFWWKHPWITDYIVILCEAFFSLLLLSLQRRKAKVVKKSSTAEWRINFAPQKVIIVLMMSLPQRGRICYEIVWTKFSPKVP